MSINRPPTATHRSRFLWIGASLCAVTLGGGALYAATDDDTGDSKPAVSTATDPHEDPLVTRYGQTPPRPHDEFVRGPVGGAHASEDHDPLVIRYGTP